jgi:hypothetical protein
MEDIDLLLFSLGLLLCLYYTLLLQIIVGGYVQRNAKSTVFRSNPLTSLNENARNSRRGEAIGALTPKKSEKGTKSKLLSA